MAVSSTNLSDTDLIHQEMAEARRSLDRYHDLTSSEHRTQQERLDVLERRIDRLERSTEMLHREVAGVLDSRIWRTLVRVASLVGKAPGGNGRSEK